MPSLPELPLGNIPRTAMHDSHGLVRVKAYHGKDLFTVVNKDDQNVITNRNKLKFLKPKKKKVGKPTFTPPPAKQVFEQGELFKAEMPPKPARFAGSDEAWAKIWSDKEKKFQAGTLSKPKVPKVAVAASPPHFRPPSPPMSRKQLLGLAVAIPAGAAAVHYGSKKRVEKFDRNDSGKTVLAAGGGAVLADSADTVAGAALKYKARKVRESNPYTDEQKARLKEHQRVHGLVDSRGRGRAPIAADSHAVKNKYYRSLPSDLSDAKWQKLNALRDNKTAPVLAVGALAGGAYAVHHRNKLVKKSDMSPHKTLTPLDDVVSKSIPSTFLRGARGAKVAYPVKIGDLPGKMEARTGGWFLKPMHKITVQNGSHTVVTSSGGGLTGAGKSTLVAAGGVAAGGTVYEHDRRYAKRPTIKPSMRSKRK